MASGGRGDCGCAVACSATGAAGRAVHGREGHVSESNTDSGRRWIETHGLFGSYVIYDTSPQWPWPTQNEAHLLARIEQLERRVARLETMQRRKPKRKAGRR